VDADSGSGFLRTGTVRDHTRERGAAGLTVSVEDDERRRMLSGVP
jgi:hypothetical protein